MRADPDVPALDPARIKVIVATDCGSTTTKAIMIEEVEGVFRQTFRGEAPTTVEEPFADVTVGVVNSVTELQELSGRRLIADDGTIIRRSSIDEKDGCDIYISTSSAGGTRASASMSFFSLKARSSCTMAVGGDATKTACLSW